MAEWYYVDNGAQAGPVSAEELQNKVTAGLLPPDSLVWTETLPEWTPFSAIPELQPTPTAPPPAAAPTPVAAAAPVSPVAPAPAPEPEPQPMGAMASAPAGEAAPLDPSQIGRIRLGEALGEGWKVFTGNFLQAVILFVVFIAVNIGVGIVGAILGIIPLLGNIFMYFAQGYLLVGMWRAAISLADKQTPPIGILFPGKEYILMPGLANMVLNVVAMIVLVLLIIPFGGLTLLTTMINDPHNEEAIGHAMLGFMAFAIPIFLVWAIVVWFFMLWPALVADRNENPFSALLSSFKCTWPSALNYVLLLIVLGIVWMIGMLLLVIGLIPAGAFGLCVLGVAYRQIVPATHRAV